MSSDRVFCLRSTVQYYHHKKIEVWLPRCSEQGGVLVACNEADQSQILGWIVGEKYDGMTAIHYAYTKRDFRNLGIARRLLQELENELHGEFGDRGPARLYSHTTKVINAQRKSGKFNKFCQKLQEERFVYHPYLQSIGLPENWHGNTNPVHQVPRKGALVPDGDGFGNKIERGPEYPSEKRDFSAVVERRRPFRSDDEREELRTFRPIARVSDQDIDEEDFEGSLEVTQQRYYGDFGEDAVE